MKSKLLFPFIIILSILISSSLLLTYFLNRSFDQNKAIRELAVVNMNDVVKSTQDYLSGKSITNLEEILKREKISLILYDMSGTVLYKDKEQKEQIVKEDVNWILSETNAGQKVAFVSYRKGLSEKYALAVIATNRSKTELSSLRQNAVTVILILSLVSGLLTAAVFLYIHLKITKPFRKLEHFAGEVAKGNLDMSLEQGRRNFFGAFTWAFDMLRNELKSSKEREMQSEKTKKELVAALSHDVRTPIASIRAYAECLKSLPDKSGPRADKYIDVILEKTDEIAKLSQDMFMHAISDLEKLEINPSEYSGRELLNSIIEPLMLQYENRIMITSPFPDVKVITDKTRLAQVFENIISNTEKYSSGSDIQLKPYLEDGMLVCCIRDFGHGVPPEDIPFIFEKFYRGKNAKESGKSGSGIGLYISRYIMEKTDGWIKGYNYHEDGTSGFAAEVAIQLKKN